MSYQPPTDRVMKEILDRCVRMETRIVRGFEQLGADPVMSHPKWHGGQIQVTSPEASLSSCLKVIPKEWPEGKPVVVYCGNDYITTIAH